MNHQIEGKLIVTYNKEVKAIIDTWENYDVSLEEFIKAILVKGLDYAKANGALAWIVDSSKAEGVFIKDIQDFIASVVFPTFTKSGIKYFITISSKKSELTRKAVSEYSTKVGSNGLELLEVQNVEEAIKWLKLQN